MYMYIYSFCLPVWREGTVGEEFPRCRPLILTRSPLKLRSFNEAVRSESPLFDSQCTEALYQSMGNENSKCQNFVCAPRPQGLDTDLPDLRPIVMCAF